MIWNYWKRLRKDVSVGLFLAIRDIRRGNPWTTGLIIFVMSLTFFNMLLMGGILLGIAEGAISSFEKYYSSNVLITPLTTKNSIEQTEAVQEIIRSLPTLRSFSNRYTAPGVLEYRYKNKIRATDLPESAGGTLVGIDPTAEDTTTHLAQAVVAGSFLSPTDVDEVVLGSSLIQKYSTARGAANAIGTRILKTADIGDRVLLTANGKQREMTIKGVITTYNSATDGRIFITESVMRDFMGGTNLDSQELAISLIPGESNDAAKSYLVGNLTSNNINANLIVQTAAEAIPLAITSIIDTFTILGNIVGVIALIVGAVTIFIVIFVNAVTRRKFIGILKGIGISARAIEISYILQAMFYAIAGIIVASVIIMGLLKPYIALHPIQYPIAPGSLAITTSDVVVRAIVLTVTALISGFIPAWIVTRQNTLDSILGR